jgi:hypothetical protein
MWLLEANLALSGKFNSGTEVYHKTEDISGIVPRTEEFYHVTAL